MNKILNKTSAIFIASLTGLLLVITLVNPDNSSVILIFLPIILTWIVGVSGLKTLLNLTNFKNNRLWSVISYIVVSFAIVLMLLSGLGQLSVQDIIITVFLATLVTFYIHRTNS